MKRLSTLTLSVFLFSGLIFAESQNNSSSFRVSGLLVDEIIDGGDSGIGSSAEFAFIIQKNDKFFTTVGYEIGFIQSNIENGRFGAIPFELVEITGSDRNIFEVEGDTTDIDTDLIPFFVNYRIRGGLEDPNAFWEIGLGFGAAIVSVDIELVEFPDLSSDELVFAGQFFGNLGYKLTEKLDLLFGIRYMVSEDYDFQDSVKLTDDIDLVADFQLDDMLNSMVFDISLNLAF